MKKVMVLVVLFSIFLRAQEQDALELTAPVDYIDFTVLDQSIQVWRQQVIATLDEQEQQVVLHFIKLGSLFSLVDLQARQAVRELLPLVWQLHEEVTAGRKAAALLQQIERQGEKFHQLIMNHDILLEEWRRWTDALDIMHNQNVLDVLEQLHEQVRSSVERCLGARDWQQIALLIPPVLEDNAKVGKLLSSLCSTEVGEDHQENVVPEKEGEAEITPEEELDHPVTYFSWLTNAANLFNARSRESIEATSQLLRYQEELLTISGVIFNKYLRALDAEQSLQEMVTIPLITE